jgi:hypothetical protein
MYYNVLLAMTWRSIWHGLAKPIVHLEPDVWFALMPIFNVPNNPLTRREVPLRFATPPPHMLHVAHGACEGTF